MEYLILMTVAGSGLILLYWVWGRCFHDYLTPYMRYGALTMTLLVYLVPWVWLKGIYGYVVYWFLPVRVPVISGHPVALADIVTEEEVYRTPDYWWRLAVFGIWMLVALVRLAHKAKLYFDDRRVYLDTAERCQGGIIMETVDRLREELHYKGRLEVYITPDKNTSFTLGVFRPLIFLQEEYSEGQLYFILKHEMIHVIRKDLLKKLMMEFACCIHWFNYLIYAMNDLFKEVCEEACDERVLQDATEEEARIYGRLLAENCSRLQGRVPPRWEKVSFESRLVDVLDTTEERIILIIKRKPIERWKKRLATGVFAGLLVLNSFTALAYPDVYHVESGSVKAGKDSIEGDAFWTETLIEDGYKDNEIEVLYEVEFINMEGNVYPVNFFNPHVFCLEHDIELGFYQVHIQDNTDGCTVILYESKRCAICHAIWIGELYKTSEWSYCSH